MGRGRGGSVQDDGVKGVSAEQRERDRRLAWIIVGISSIVTVSLAVLLIWAAWGAMSHRMPAVAGPPPEPMVDRRWPMAPSVVPATTARPIGNPAAWFGPDEYPAAALRRGDQGRVRVLLEIDADGRPRGCSLIETSGHASLDDGTCDVVMGVGRFDRAGRGRHRSRYWRSPPVRWVLPED